MGRPQFAQPGTSGGGQTVAISDRPEIEVVTATQSGSVSAGTVESVDVYAPVGAVYRGNSLFLRVASDATATTGSHFFQVISGPNSLLKGNNGYSSEIRFNNNYWQTVGATEMPPAVAAQGQTVQSLRATENESIQVRYRNDTDAAQDNDRTIRFVFEEVSY